MTGVFEKLYAYDQMMFVSFNRNKADVTNGAGTVNLSEAPEFTPGFKWSSCCSIFRFPCIVLQITVSHFGILILAIV